MFFKISFNFPEKRRDQILNLPIHDYTKEIIRNIQSNGVTLKFIPIIFGVDNEQ
ncbi:MAG: hypothetical protein RR531_11795 [Longicatena sp.]